MTMSQLLFLTLNLLIMVSICQDQTLHNPPELAQRKLFQQKNKFYQVVAKEQGKSSNDLLKKLEQFQLSLQAANQKLRQQEIQINILNTNLTDQRTLVKQIKNRSDELEQSYAVLKNKTIIIQRENIDLKINKSNLQNHITDIQKNNIILQMNLTRVTKQKNHFEAQVVKAVKNINQLQAQLSKGCQRCPGGHANCDQFKQIIQRLQRQVINHQQKLKQINKTNEAECKQKIRVKIDEQNQIFSQHMNQLVTGLQDCNNQLKLAGQHK